MAGGIDARLRSGIYSAADALKNWHDSKTGRRRGRRVGFPRFKKKGRSTPSVSFVEINHQLSWLSPDRHHVRLMLPRSSPDRDFTRRREHLGWLHTVESTAELYRLVESDLATIQKVTFSYRGGRWRAAFQVRYREAPSASPVRWLGPLVGVDLGIRNLATLSVPVTGLTDAEGHVPNPNVLQQQLGRLRRLDRQIARAQAGSNSRSGSSDAGPGSTAASPRPGRYASTGSPGPWPAPSTLWPSRTSTSPTWPTANATWAGAWPTPASARSVAS